MYVHHLALTYANECSFGINKSGCNDVVAVKMVDPEKHSLLTSILVNCIHPAKSGIHGTLKSGFLWLKIHDLSRMHVECIAKMKKLKSARVMNLFFLYRRIKTAKRESEIVFRSFFPLLPPLTPKTVILQVSSSAECPFNIAKALKGVFDVYRKLMFFFSRKKEKDEENGKLKASTFNQCWRISIEQHKLSLLLRLSAAFISSLLLLFWITKDKSVLYPVLIYHHVSLPCTHTLPKSRGCETYLQSNISPLRTHYNFYDSHAPHLSFAPSTQQRRWILSVERAMCSCGRTFFYRLSSHQSVPVLLLCASSYGDRKWKFVVVATALTGERWAKKSCKLFLYFSWFSFFLSDFLFHIFSFFVLSSDTAKNKTRWLAMTDSWTWCDILRLLLLFWI